MKYYTYTIQSLSDGSYYVGSTEDIKNRLGKHNKGRVRSTKSKRPFKLVYCEKFDSRQEAYKRERQIKSYKGGEAFKKILRVGTQAVNEDRL